MVTHNNLVSGESTHKEINLSKFQLASRNQSRYTKHSGLTADFPITGVSSVDPEYEYSQSSLSWVSESGLSYPYLLAYLGI